MGVCIRTRCGGCQRHRHLHLASVKIRNKGRRKYGFKNNKKQKQQQNNYKQSNLHGKILESIDVKHFGNIILFAEHCLDLHKIELEHVWHHRMCMYSYVTFFQLIYNIHDRKNAPQYQAGGSGFTINENYRDRKAAPGKDASNLGIWSWVRIEGKNN